MHRPIIEFFGSRVVQSLKCIRRKGDEQSKEGRSKVLQLFESQIEAEIYVSMAVDNGENIQNEESAKVFRKAFRKANSAFREHFRREDKDHQDSLSLSGLRLGPSTMITLNNILAQQSEVVYLSIANNPITDGGMSSVKSILSLNRIRVLNLASVMLSEKGLRVILQPLAANTALLSLDLGVCPQSLLKNPLGLEGSKYIAVVLMNNCKMEELRLEDNDLGEEGAVVLSKALRENSTLRKLRLANNGIGCAGATELLKFARNLQRLDLSGNLLKNQVCPDIKQYFWFNNSIQVLILDHNRIQAEGVRQLVKGLEFSKLSALSLVCNQIGDKGVEHLSNVLANPDYFCHTHLLKLSLRGNFVTEVGAAHIARALAVCALKELDLSQNSIKDRGLLRLVDALDGQASKLHNLVVSQCQIGDQAILKFFQKLPKLKLLVHVNCNNNFVSQACEKQLLQLIQSNCFVTSLDLRGNRLSLASLSKIKKITDHNFKAARSIQPEHLRKKIAALKAQYKKAMEEGAGAKPEFQDLNPLKHQKAKLENELIAAKQNSRAVVEDIQRIRGEREQCQRRSNNLQDKLRELRQAKEEQAEALRRAQLRLEREEKWEETQQRPAGSRLLL